MSGLKGNKMEKNENERKRGVDMIPEIHDKFIVMNWLREQKIDYDENFEKLTVRHQTNIVALNGTIESFVNKLKSEINEIAKEYGNSYLDENGNTVWVESKLEGV